jgi:hypothetical protein
MQFHGLKNQDEVQALSSKYPGRIDDMRLNLDGVTLLSADEQIRVLTQLAAHYREMSLEAHTEGASLAFIETSREMDRRASTVTTRKAA